MVKTQHVRIVDCVIYVATPKEEILLLSSEVQMHRYLAQWRPCGLIKGNNNQFVRVVLKTQQRGAQRAVARPADAAANVLQILISEEHEPQGLQPIQ